MNNRTEVDIFIPCFIDQLYPQTAFNMVKILERLGCKVNYNPNQTCCGQPAYNAGYFAEATEVAGKFLSDFTSKSKYIISPSASCVGMVRNGYDDLFKDSIQTTKLAEIKLKTFELTEFLVDILHVDKIPGAKLKGRATYHDSCAALRECGIKSAPRKLLSNVEGLELVEMPETDSCCGFGGTFAVKFESISVGMGEIKLENAQSVNPDYLISTDSSCLLQYETLIKKREIPIKPMHIADVLASGW